MRHNERRTPSLRTHKSMYDLGSMCRWPSCVALACLLGCGRIGYNPVALTRDAGQPDAALPDAALPDAAHPDAALPDAALPDADVADADVADATSDAGAFCQADPCVLVLPQCGCAAGEMCQRTGDTTDERGCVVAGDIPADEECPADRDCVPGHACITLAGDTGRCHSYCDDDTDCAPGLACGRYDEGVGIGVCGSSCTLEGGCPAGTACKVILVYDLDTDDPVALPLCAEPAGAADGSACASGLDCAAGLYCDSDVCRPMCRQDGSLPCATGTCQSALAPIRLGNVEHGVCR